MTQALPHGLHPGPMDGVRPRSRPQSPLFEPLEPRLLLSAVKEPYLQAAALDSIYVLVEATSQTAAVVEYGLTSDYGGQAATESTQASGTSGYYVHNVKLTGLEPNTQYHYRVTHGSTTSADQTFWTAAPAGTDYRFVFMADSRTDPEAHALCAAQAASFDPRFVVFGGDTCYENTWDSWNEQFFLPEQEALNARAPFFLAPGNHEGWHTLTRAYTQGFNGDGSGYLSFDYGDAHFLILNNEVDYAEGSAQWNFAAADLAATTQPWKFVAFHKSAYAVGHHDENAGMKAMTTALFEPNGVDMCLTGHNHYYQHNRVNGIEHMVIGSTGAPLQDPGAKWYTVYSESTFCFGVFDMTATTCDLTVYDEAGAVVEAIHLAKDPTPPTAPTNLYGSPGGDGRIDLGWAAAADPESGIGRYMIYRDGQFVGATAATSYSDTGLAADTSYTYEVSAVNRGQTEGPRSSPATARTLTGIAFQQGVGGYVGTVDTALEEADPNTAHNTTTSLRADADSPGGSGKAVQSLIRFEDLFGDGPGQISADVNVLSAALEFTVFNSGDPIRVHRMLVPWQSTDTWNSRVGGIQADDVEAAAAPEATTGPVGTGTLFIDVTASLLAWRAAPATNFGWAILPTGDDGVDFYSAQGTTPPRLRVGVVLPGPNHVPVALGDVFAVDEDATLVVPAPGVMANDSDANGHPLTAVLIVGVSRGTLEFESDGSFYYTPERDFYGQDAFTYRVNDGQADSNIATVSIVVTPLIPTISDILDQTTSEDTPAGPISFTVGDVETPAELLTLTATSSNTALLPDASIVFGGSGSSRTVTLTPAQGRSGTSTVTITVTNLEGHTAHKYFVLTVLDVTAPWITAISMNDYPGHTVKTVSQGEPSGIGVRKLTVTFSEAVTFDASDVLVEKVTFGAGSETIGDTLTPLLLSGSGTDVMTIEFTSASVVDTWVKVTLKGSATLTDVAGNLLDGEAQRGAAGAGFIRDAALDLPSGDGVAGGSAFFYVASLRGDYQDDELTPGPPDGQITLSDVDGFAAAFQANRLDADFQDDELMPGPPDGVITLSDVDGFAAAFQGGKTLTALPAHLTYGASAGAPEPLALAADAGTVLRSVPAYSDATPHLRGGTGGLSASALSNLCMSLADKPSVAPPETGVRQHSMLDGAAPVVSGAALAAGAAVADPSLDPDGGLPDWQAGVDLLALPALEALGV